MMHIRLLFPSSASSKSEQLGGKGADEGERVYVHILHMHVHTQKNPIAGRSGSSEAPLEGWGWGKAPA